jgi:hypothetical protein
MRGARDRPEKFEEREGFEPSVRCRTHDFQSCPFGHSGTSPDRSAISAEERVGVEPTLDLRPNLISNQAPSATRPSLQDCLAHAKADRLSPDAGPVDWFRAGGVDEARSASIGRNEPTCLRRVREPPSPPATLSPMATPAKRRASYEDVLRAPENTGAEVIDGELRLSPRPGKPHATAPAALGEELGPPFKRGRGDRRMDHSLRAGAAPRNRHSGA